jgi:hypothetical protein
MPKYHPRRPDFLADTKPPAKFAKPCTPNTQGSMFDSFKEEPVSRMDRMRAPTASQMPDQYRPEATGEALRSPNMRDNELNADHS